MKNLFSIIALLIACLPSLAQQGTSFRATNGVGFGVSTFNGPVAATNLNTTNQFAGKFRQGSGTTSSGTGASAFGLGSRASGNYSHAEGLYTVSGNSGAHSEGTSNVVSGASGHAEGVLTEASGTAGHAQGIQTVANGTASHAGGYQVELQSGADYSFGGGLNIIALGTVSNSFLWNADWGNTMSPPTGSVFMVDAPNGIFFDGNVYVSGGSLVGDGSGLTNLPPSAGVSAISYTVSGGGQAIVNGVYTNGTSTSWLHGSGPTATALEYHPGESPTWIFYNQATPLYSAEALTGPWTIEVGGLAPAPTVLVGGGNFGVFYGDGANLTNIGANSIKSMWASNVFSGGTLAVGSIVSSGTITGNGAGLTNLNVTDATGEVVPVPAGFTFTNAVTVYRKGSYYWQTLTPAMFDLSRTATRYVLTNGSDANDGLSWATAKLTLTNALTNVSTSVKVYFGQGTWTGIGTSNVTFTKDISLVCTGGLATIGSVSINNADVYCSNMQFVAYGANNPFTVSDAGTTNMLGFINCSFSAGTVDGLVIGANGGLAYVRDCGSVSNANDGFDYGAQAGTTTLCLVEERCSAAWNGSTGNDANNGSTIHTGARIIRLHGSYTRSEGRNVHDIGSGGSWNINCVAGGSRLSGADRDVGFACAATTDATFMQLDGCSSWMGSALSYLYSSNGVLRVNPFAPLQDSALRTQGEIYAGGIVRANNGLTASNSITAGDTTDINASLAGSGFRAAGGANFAKQVSVGSNLVMKVMASTSTNAGHLLIWNSNNFGLYARGTNGVDKALATWP